MNIKITVTSVYHDDDNYNKYKPLCFLWWKSLQILDEHHRHTKNGKETTHM